MEYILDLPSNERLAILDVREEIRLTGYDAFLKLNTRQLRGKLWEIKVGMHRIMYVILNADSVVFLHIFKKQKNKTERQEIELALKRARDEKIMGN